MASGFIDRRTEIAKLEGAWPQAASGHPQLALVLGRRRVGKTFLLNHFAKGKRAVLGRRRPQWQRHIGWVFEEQAWAHTARLVAAGTLPEDLVVGRWWASTGEPCEVDVIGLSGAQTAMLGEAKWQERPLGARELRELMAKSTRIPDVVDRPQIVLRGRGGLDAALAGPGNWDSVRRTCSRPELRSSGRRRVGWGFRAEPFRGSTRWKGRPG